MAYHVGDESPGIKYKYMEKEKLIALLNELPEEVKYVVCNVVENITLLDSDKECIGMIDTGWEELTMWEGSE